MWSHTALKKKSSDQCMNTIQCSTQSNEKIFFWGGMGKTEEKKSIGCLGIVGHS